MLNTQIRCVHIKGSPRATHIIFSWKESFFYIRARERASFHLRDHAASISPRNFFADAIRPNSAGKKKKKKRNRYRVISLPLSLLRPAVPLVKSRSLIVLSCDCADTLKVDVPMLDENSACKQLHNDFGRRAWKFANINSPGDATPSRNFYLFSSDAKNANKCGKMRARVL